MKKIIILFFLIIFLQCVAQEIPILKVDHDHWMIERNDGSIASSYEITPTDEFILDISEYNFSGTPNFIFISMGADYKYAIQWQPDTMQYVVSEDTLKPLAGAKPFPGFYAGQEVAIFIGQIDPINGNFNALWYSIINVK